MINSAPRHISRRHAQSDTRRPGQGLVEFALILPVLLLTLFGIIEFARILQAWLSVENGARFGVRYAVTGEYNLAYCTTAYIDQLSGGDPTLHADLLDDGMDGTFDCQVASTTTLANYVAETDALTNLARIQSTIDVATGGAVAILRNPDPSIQETDAGYFKVTVCSTRDTDGVPGPDFNINSSRGGQF